MKRSSFLPVAVLSTFVLFGTAYASASASVSQVSQLSGTTTHWQNQRGSLLTLNFDGQGHVTGTFTNEAPGSCPASVGVPQPVVGTYDGSVVSFVVDFPKCYASTVWNAQLTDSSQTMDSLWIVSANGSSPDYWNNNYVGHDTFKLVG